MHIQSAKYADASGDLINAVVDDDEVTIPNDPANRHMAALAQWVAGGNAIEPFEEPQAVVPSSISRRQFFQVLANREMITREEALAAMARGEIPEDFETLIQMIADDELEWQARALIAGATDFERANGFVEFIGAFKGMNSADMDQLWRDGALA